MSPNYGAVSGLTLKTLLCEFELLPPLVLKAKINSNGRLWSALCCTTRLTLMPAFELNLLPAQAPLVSTFAIPPAQMQGPLGGLFFLLNI
jgi:hypothetical protein